MILVDTCVLLWLALDQKRISRAARELLELHDGARCISAISALEIGWKARRGKLDLRTPVPRWLEIARERFGLDEAAVTWDIATRAVELPFDHSDPFDRIIAATASVNDWTLLSPDAAFRACHGLRVTW